MSLIVLALVVGALIGLLVQPAVPAALAPYLPMAIVAAMDALLGAARARLEGSFSERTFVLSLATNAAFAAALVWTGDRLGIGEFSTAVVVVFSLRIFQNLAAIRRRILGG